ncbi:MAG: hypothetical protein ABIR63_05765 [Sphingomicrobium sp.]
MFDVHCTIKERDMTMPARVREEAPSDELGFLLRRAEQESVAAIRSINSQASERHDAMAYAYSARAVTMLGRSGAGTTATGAKGQADSSRSGCSR